VVPRVGKRGPGLVGNERLLSAGKWREILAPVVRRVETFTYPDWKVLTFAGITVPYPNHVLVTARR
jgi:hypothetical protein